MAIIAIETFDAKGYFYLSLSISKLGM